MAKKMFTEAGLERLGAPENGRVEFGDSVVPGLMLRVSDSGVKSWSVLYKVKGEGGASATTGRPLKGTQRRISLGVYPILGVKQARDTAMDVLQKAFDGTDARVTRNETLLARQSNTVEAVGRRFIDQDAKPNIESWSKIERALELHVYVVWGERNIHSPPRRSRAVGRSYRQGQDWYRDGCQETPLATLQLGHRPGDYCRERSAAEMRIAVQSFLAQTEALHRQWSITAS